MITLFRRIRQKLIDSGSVTRYLLYAIGEILLVVIGILIALQVNNWNGERIAKQYEQTLLIELQEAIQNDIAFFGDHLLNNRNVLKRETHLYFEQLIRGAKVDMTQFEEKLQWLQYGNTFHVNDGAYESIKSSGLDKISNKEIRSKTTKLYEFDLPRYKDLMSFPMNELNEARQQDLPKLMNDPEFTTSGAFEIEYRPVAFDVKTNPNFLRLLQKSIQFEQSSSRYYQSMLEKYRELDQLLTQELNK